MKKLRLHTGAKTEVDEEAEVERASEREREKSRRRGAVETM